MHDCLQAQRARGKLICEVKKNFFVDAFIGNATDWEKICLGNLVGLPVIVIPTGFKNISDPPPGGTLRRTTINTGIYAPPDHDHIVSSIHHHIHLPIPYTKLLINIFFIHPTAHLSYSKFFKPSAVGSHELCHTVEAYLC